MLKSLSIIMLPLIAVSNTAISAEIGDYYLIQGKEEVKSYTARVDEIKSGDSIQLMLHPDTFVLRNGIYKNSDGTCSEIKTVLIELKKEGLIEVPNIRSTSISISCPT